LIEQALVNGEKRYWLHIAIDRFDGTVVGQQLVLPTLHFFTEG